MLSHLTHILKVFTTAYWIIFHAVVLLLYIYILKAWAVNSSEFNPDQPEFLTIFSRCTDLVKVCHGISPAISQSPSLSWYVRV